MPWPSRNPEFSHETWWNFYHRFVNVYHPGYSTVNLWMNPHPKSPAATPMAIPDLKKVTFHAICNKFPETAPSDHVSSIIDGDFPTNHSVSIWSHIRNIDIPVYPIIFQYKHCMTIYFLSRTTFSLFCRDYMIKPPVAVNHCFRTNISIFFAGIQPLLSISNHW